MANNLLVVHVRSVLLVSTKMLWDLTVVVLSVLQALSQQGLEQRAREAVHWVSKNNKDNYS